MTQIVYVSSPKSQEIYVWKLNETCNILELIQIVRTSGEGQPIAIHPNKQFLYIGVRPNFGVSTYCIDPLSGLLTFKGTIEVFGSPTHLLCDIQGRYLYSTSYNFNNISIVSLNELGILNASSVQIIENLLGCHSANISSDNLNLLWVPCLLDNTIRLFKIENSFSVLTPWNPEYIRMNIKSGPRHMVFNNSGNYAYLVNELNSTVSVVKYNFAIKELKIIQTLSMFPKNMDIKQYWGSDIHITPDTQWLYCSDRANNLISFFMVHRKTKQLKLINSQFTEILQPRGFAIDCTGTFLIVAGQLSDNVALYRINKNNGKLTKLSCYSSGQSPMWVSIILIN